METTQVTMATTGVTTARNQGRIVALRALVATGNGLRDRIIEFKQTTDALEGPQCHFVSQIVTLSHTLSHCLIDCHVTHQKELVLSALLLLKLL